MGNIINNEAHKAYDFIEKGRVILYPTDTVWGLGCDATNCSAIGKIYKLKKRSLKTPMLSLVKDINMIVKYTNSSLNEVSQILESTSGPTTVIYPKGRNLCKYILSEDGSMGCNRRICATMMYLNDNFEGGETEFLYIHRRYKPKRGQVLIWPAGFTHTHRGLPPLDGDKYISTSWLENING